MKEITKEEFELFAEREFPNKSTCYADGYCFIQAGTCLGKNLHYELNAGKIHMDIEGPNWRPIRNYLWKHVKDPRVSHSHWGRYGCRWTLDYIISNSEDVKCAFRLMRSIMDAHILNYENEFEQMQNNLLTQMNQTQVAKVKAKITSIHDCLQKRLNIPVYQRPYRWKSKNVIQLLEDINGYRKSGKNIYRIGGLILHKNGDAYDIVDGQQRLTTILIIIKCLCEKMKHELVYNERFDELKYPQSDSYQNIRDNYAVINSWMENNITSDEQAFYDYLVGDNENGDGCQFVEIVVDNLSEAFQMFDTQNGRGKELEAYNLLKAYHIRAMEQDSEKDKIACDKRWEYATTYKSEAIDGSDSASVDILKYLFEETLYRNRLWCRGKEAGKFSKHDIDEFKGFTIDKNHSVVFPFQNPQLLQYITSKFYESVLSGTIGTISRFKDGDPENINPFVNINQTIVNGKAFFDYIETFVEIYKRLFLELDGYQLRQFKQFYKDYCQNTYGRSGDKYLQDIYKSLIVLIFDKFGERGVIELHERVFVFVYQFRITQAQVRYDGLSKKREIIHAFSQIYSAKDMATLDFYNIKDPISVKFQSDKFGNDNEPCFFKPFHNLKLL